MTLVIYSFTYSLLLLLINSSFNNLEELETMVLWFLERK